MQKKTNVFYIFVSILLVILLLLYYLYIYLYQRYLLQNFPVTTHDLILGIFIMAPIRFGLLYYRGMKRETQVLKRISQASRKKKPS